MSLVEEIQKNENVRRIFGKREISIMRRQLWGMQLSPSEKTRLSRDIRKKLSVIQQLIPYTSEFQLKHGGELHKRIKYAKEIILQHELAHRITKIIVFGSVAEKEHRLGSDIDIAVVFSSINDLDAAKFRMRISGRLPDTMDIQVYNTLPDKIKRQIDAHGKIIYQRKD